MGAHFIASPASHTPRIASVGTSERFDRGGAIVEYGLLIALVALIAFLSIVLFGEAVVSLFEPSEPISTSTP